MKALFVVFALALSGCHHVTVNYKCNIESDGAQIRQQTEVSPDVQ